MDKLTLITVIVCVIVITACVIRCFVSPKPKPLDLESDSSDPLMEDWV